MAATTGKNAAQATEAPEKPKADEAAQIPDVIGILPLKNTVMFPYTVVPLSVGEKSSVALVDEAVSGSKIIGCVAMKDPSAERKPENLY